MMTSLLTFAIGALTVFSLAVSVWGLARRREANVAQLRQQRLEADLKKKAQDLDYFEERNQTLAADRARLEAERDRYRAIAITRELPTPQMLPEHVRILDPIWTDRIYANHPRVNLARLQADLADHAHEVLMLTIRLDPRGGWTRKLRNPPERSYSGRVQRILEDLECWLKDDDMRLVERRSDGIAWTDDDSPLHFHVDLARVTDAKPEVHVHAVEVAVVETKVLERFVEQPVVIEVPTMPGDTVDVTVGLSREEVLALFEVELESKLAELNLQRIEPESVDDDRRRRAAVIGRKQQQ